MRPGRACVASRRKILVAPPSAQRLDVAAHAARAPRRRRRRTARTQRRATAPRGRARRCRRTGRARARRRSDRRRRAARMLNSDSRSRSAVGRIACDFGAASVRPRKRPPTIRISAAAAWLFVGAARPCLDARSCPSVAAREPALEGWTARASVLRLGIAAGRRPSRLGARPSGLRVERAVGAARLRVTVRCSTWALPAMARPPRSRARSSSGPEKSAPASAAMRSPSCSRSARVLTSSTAPAGSSPSWNGPYDTRISRFTCEPERAQHVPDFAVLALAHGEREPDVGALHAVERRLDRAVADAVDRDAVAQARRAAPA